MKYKTEQEKFWAGKFGSDYIERNDSLEQFASYLKFWSQVLRYKDDIRSAIEFGSNIGVNVQALKMLLPKAELAAVEINSDACKRIAAIGTVEIFNKSILEFKATKKYDLVFTRGVLIHINPDYLPEVYKQMYECTNNGKYILIDEYYNPYPVSIDYRGEKNKLFKRDFAGELTDTYPNLKLVDYGCTYHRDGCSDDSNWFLMKKQ